MRFMEQKFFHGELSNRWILPERLVAEFNRGNLRAQVVGAADKLAVQIGTRPGAASGGTTALTITIQRARGRRGGSDGRSGMARYGGLPWEDDDCRPGQSMESRGSA